MKFTADKVKGNISDTIYGSAFSAPCRFNKNFILKNALVYCYFANVNGMGKVSSVHANLSWQLLLKTHLSADLLAWERDNDSYIFVNQAIKHQKSTLASYQTSNNL